MTSLAVPPTGLNPVLPQAPRVSQDDPQRVRDAATQFESLLIGQMLHSARETGAGWLGTEDSTSDCATDYAEQQFAAVMAKAGGLGIASMIEHGLQAPASLPMRSSQPPAPRPAK